MKRRRDVLGMAIALLVSAGAGGLSAQGPDTGAPLVLAANYSASGTHQCRAADRSTHTCIVTGLYFGNCIEADSSLRTQDCCPSTRLCGRDSQGRETQCRLGGASTGFAMNYCIPGF